MATGFSQRNFDDFGVIILGNSGAGKSFLCNILLGENRFKHEFQAAAVTTKTEYCESLDDSRRMRIYNIPGLVESHQERIDRNKKEIMRAFELSPVSVVIFVWRQTGGRVQNDDIIAFNALNKAYKFPQDSLMFVVNDLPPRRPPEYDGNFFLEVRNQVKELPVDMKSTVFIDKLDPDDKQKMNNARARLFDLIAHHYAAQQKIQASIDLEADKLNEMRRIIDELRKENGKHQENYENEVKKLTEELESVKEKANQRINTIEQQRSDQANHNIGKHGPFTYLGMALDSAGEKLMGIANAPGNILKNLF